MSVFSALTGAGAVFCVIAVGFIAAKRGHLPPDTERVITVLTLTYAVPALIFTNTVEHLSLDVLKEDLGRYIGLPFLIISAGYALALGLGAVLKLSREERGVTSALFSMANVIFIGLPVCIAIFGEEITPYVVSYIPANTVLFWTIGNIGMTPSKKLKVKELLKQVFSPPLLSFILALLFAVFSIKLPAFLMSGLKILGGMPTPAALFIVGAALCRMDIKKLFKIPKIVALVLVGRVVIMPVLAFLICRLFQASREITAVFTILSAMPVMTQSVLVARRNNIRVDDVAHAFALTTLVSMLCIPLLVLILGVL